MVDEKERALRDILRLIGFEFLSSFLGALIGSSSRTSFFLGNYKRFLDWVASIVLFIL